MTPKTKKRIIIGTSVAVFVGIVAYILWKRKKDKENALATPPPSDVTPPIADTLTTASNSGAGKPTQPKESKPPVVIQTPKANPNAGAKVNAVDLLASNIKGGNAKGLFANLNNLNILNQNGQVAGKTKAGARIGSIISAEKTPTAYKITIYGTGGIKYHVFAPIGAGKNAYSIQL